MTATAGTTWYVRMDGNDAWAGTSWPTALATVSNAYVKAASGDQIWVAEGTYYPTTIGGPRSATFKPKSNVSLYGGFTNGMASFSDRNWTVHRTVLSAEIGTAAHADNSYNVFYCNGLTTPRIDGFTITGGCAEDAAGNPRWYGGGVMNNNSSTIIANCLFRDNSSTEGGGAVMNYGSGPIVSNCAFVGNTTSYGGGGGILNEGADCLAKVHRCVFATNVASGGTTACGGGIRNRAGTPEIRDCVFSNNAAYQGGAVHNQSSTPLISNCQFIANSAGACGAMANGGNGRPLVMDCLFASNRAPSAGALGSVGAGAGGRIVNCRFVANAATTAGEYGGAIFSYYDRSVISNCCFLGNRSGLGGGIGIYDTASNYIVNCTFASNTATSTGGGLYTRSTSAQAMDNCILWANASPSGPNFYRRTPSGSVTFRFADVQGCGGSGAGWNAAFGTDGGGNIDADPLFADLPKWDAHEKSLIGRWTPGGIWVQDAQHSPCIDAGNDAFPVGKEPSPNGGRINMGAYGGTAQASKSRVLSGSMVAIL